MPRRAVGRNVDRKEGTGKVTGRALYLDDLSFPHLLHARTIRSTVPCGEILDIRLDFDRDGFIVVDHRDIPGRNVVALIDDDQPCLAERIVRHVAEPVLLLAHADRERLAAATVAVAYREQTPNYDPERSDIAFKQIAIDKGDIDEGLAAADRIVEGEYRTGHQEQLYIEPNGVLAVPEPSGGVTLYGSLQCPYYVHRALKVLLALPEEKVRVVQTETGGGFGGKEEYPSMIAGHAALLALKSGRPVKLVYDRMEDLLATTKRHPSIVRHRTGVTRDGRLTGIDIDAVFDGGAYATLSAVVLSRGLIHATGPYRCDHVRIRGRAAMTNTPPNGAFRGFGARDVPDSGPTVASRTCMIVGRLLQRAAADMRARLGTLTPRQYLRRHGPLVVSADYEKPDEIVWDDVAYRGDAYESYGWACDVAEVEIDPVTCQARPVAFTTVHEIGRAIHPRLAAGQIEGGSAQGIGYALLEEVVMRDGRMANNQLTNYIIPTTLDTPPIVVEILENPYARGPYGAKGVGEMPIDGPAPAIVNALRHAGVDIREVPATPERIARTVEFGHRIIESFRH